MPLPEKDFKAVVKDGQVLKVGVEFFDGAMEAQAFYKLMKPDWRIWLNKIIEFCESDNRKCYAEKALNALEGACRIAALDVRDLLCAEIDNPEDLAAVSEQMRDLTVTQVKRAIL